MKIDTIKNLTSYINHSRKIRKEVFNKKQDNSCQNTENNTSLYFKAKIEPWNQARLEKIYDEVYPEFLADHPYLSELGYKKPKLVFDNKQNDISVASYSFMDNTISVYPFCKGSVYSYKNRNENSDTPGEVAPGKDYKKEIKKVIKKLDMKKLNNAEKELYYKACLMHELRHSAQVHILFSTDEYYQKCFEAAKEIYKEIQMVNSALIQVLELAKDNNVTVTGIDDIEAEANNAKQGYGLQNLYALNFKPVKKISDDAFLKFSTNPNDKRYWSTGKHLYGSYMANIKNTVNGYFLDPVEIDAYNYQFEFLKRQKPKHSVRPKIFENLQEDALFKSFFSTCLDRAGYPEFIFK